MTILYSLLFWSSQIVQLTLALYSPDGDVKLLTPKTFNEAVKEKDYLSVVEFLYLRPIYELSLVPLGAAIVRIWHRSIRR